jgi:hypothetical protein
MMTLTVVCQEEGYNDVLIYTVSVRDPNDRKEVTDAIQLERERDLWDDAKPMEVLFAFQGDLAPRVDWR